TRSDFIPGQQKLFAQLVAETVVWYTRHFPEDAQHGLSSYGPPEKDPDAQIRIFLSGDAPQWSVRLAVTASGMGQMGPMCSVLDDAALAAPTACGSTAPPPPLTDGAEPAFALPRRPTWLVGDVLADIAARARVNLIADDYTLTWPKWGRYEGP